MRATTTRRLGALGLVAAVAALPFVDCRSATYINLQIRTDGCGRINSTVVVVDTPDRIEESNTPVASKVGCEAPTLVGTLTITPSGENDAAVGIKVITGVDATPDQCKPPSYAGCIVARRTAHFTPHAAQTVDVLISLSCLDLSCDANSTCDNGICTPIPGATPPGTDGGPGRDGGGNGDAASEGGPNPPPPPPGDASVGCTPALCNDTTIKSGQSAQCDPDGYCAITCGTGGAKCDLSPCPPGVDCRIRCTSGGTCGAFECDSPGRCLVECPNNGACGSPISCKAATCTVQCEVNGACPSLTVSANQATIDCKGDNNTCKVTRVDAGSTQLSCGTGAPCQDTVVAGGSAALDCSQQGGTCGGNQVCCAGSCSGPWDVQHPAICPP